MVACSKLVNATERDKLSTEQALFATGQCSTNDQNVSQNRPKKGTKAAQLFVADFFFSFSCDAIEFLNNGLVIVFFGAFKFSFLLFIFFFFRFFSCLLFNLELKYFFILVHKFLVRVFL